MRVLLLILFCFLPSLSYAQAVKEQIAGIIEEHHSAFPRVGLSVLVSKPGEVIYEDALGYSSLPFMVETKPDHKFRIGSIYSDRKLRGLI